MIDGLDAALAAAMVVVLLTVFGAASDVVFTGAFEVAVVSTEALAGLATAAGAGLATAMGAGFATTVGADLATVAGAGLACVMTNSGRSGAFVLLWASGACNAAFPAALAFKRV